MIKITDNDTPIIVVEKIINGTKPYNPTPLVKALGKVVTGDEYVSEDINMFDLEEIKEIADHLMVYYKAHQKTMINPEEKWVK